MYLAIARKYTSIYDPVMGFIYSMDLVLSVWVGFRMPPEYISTRVSCPTAEI